MIKAIASFFTLPPTVIEIHPGRPPNAFADLTRVITQLQTTFHDTFNMHPNIYLENRTGQRIATGREIKKYWEYLRDTFPELTTYTGIVLDIQQLFTSTRPRFLEEYALILPDSVKAFHIHTAHRKPTLNDNILWKKVFEKLRTLNAQILINPEIHQKKQVRSAISFCNNLIYTRSKLNCRTRSS